MFSLHDDKTIAFENRDVATLLPGLPATLVQRVKDWLESADLGEDMIRMTLKEYEDEKEALESETWSRAIREAFDAALEACNTVDPDGADETVTKVMEAVRAAIRALDE